MLGTLSFHFGWPKKGYTPLEDRHHLRFFFFGEKNQLITETKKPEVNDYLTKVELVSRTYCWWLKSCTSWSIGSTSKSYRNEVTCWRLSGDSGMYPDPNVPLLEILTKKPFSWWVFMGSNPQESLGVHPIVPWLVSRTYHTNWVVITPHQPGDYDPPWN